MRALEPPLLCATKHLAIATDLGKQNVQTRHRIGENDPHNPDKQRQIPSQPQPMGRVLMPK